VQTTIKIILLLADTHDAYHIRGVGIGTINLALTSDCSIGTLVTPTVLRMHVNQVKVPRALETHTIREMPVSNVDVGTLVTRTAFRMAVRNVNVAHTLGVPVVSAGVADRSASARRCGSRMQFC